jgi:thiol-disulfide isomerase/thioredoxin
MKSYTRLNRGITIFILIALIVGVGTGCDRTIVKKQVKSDEFEFIGTNTKEFSVKDTNGNVVDNIIFLSYDITMINFWSYDCEPCVKEIQELVRINDKYKSEKVNMIGVAVNSEQDNIEKLMAEHDVSYTNILFDENNKLLNEAISEFDFIPFTLFIDKSGKYMDKVVIGSKSFEEFDKIIADLLFKNKLKGNSK